jgi:hypothetical protein
MKLLELLTESKPAKIFHVTFYIICIFIIFLTVHNFKPAIECVDSGKQYNNGECRWVNKNFLEKR